MSFVVINRIMFHFDLPYTAHAIVYGKDGIIRVLKTIGLEISDNAKEEEVFRLVLENKGSEILQDEFKRILREKPYYPHCTHCIEAIQPVYEKGKTISKSIIE